MKLKSQTAQNLITMAAGIWTGACGGISLTNIAGPALFSRGNVIDLSNSVTTGITSAVCLGVMLTGLKKDKKIFMEANAKTDVISQDNAVFSNYPREQTLKPKPAKFQGYKFFFAGMLLGSLYAPGRTGIDLFKQYQNGARFGARPQNSGAPFPV